MGKSLTAVPCHASGGARAAQCLQKTDLSKHLDRADTGDWCVCVCVFERLSQLAVHCHLTHSIHS